LWRPKVKEQLVGEGDASFEHTRRELILTKLRVGNMQARSAVVALASAFLITSIALGKHELSPLK
jgi:hypothetical protein